MNKLLIFFLLLTSSLAMADDSDIERDTPFSRGKSPSSSLKLTWVTSFTSMRTCRMYCYIKCHDEGYVRGVCVGNKKYKDADCYCSDL